MDRDYIRRVLSVAEGGTTEFPYTLVEAWRDDNRFDPARKQVTYSIGFTESGNLKAVLEHYAASKGVLGTELKAYTPGLGQKNRPSLHNNAAFCGLLKRAGNDPIMQQVQHEEFDKLYLEPAIAWGSQHGFQLALSFLVIADSYLHSGSMLPFLMARFPTKKPSYGGDEKQWITEYLAARKLWLENHSNKILNKTSYRANCFLIEASKGNWNLQTSMVMNGVEVHPTV